MDSTSIFVNSLLSDTVCLKPWQIGRSIKQALQTALVKKFEGICTHHGFIRPSTIRPWKWAPGVLRMQSLNGDALYQVQFYADVCNPATGLIITARLVNQNKFGFLAESVEDKVLDIIVPRNIQGVTPDAPGGSFSVGDVVMVAILGKKYQVGDCKISVVGKLVEGNNNAALSQLVAANAVALSDEEDEKNDGESDSLIDEDDVVSEISEGSEPHNEDVIENVTKLPPRPDEEEKEEEEEDEDDDEELVDDDDFEDEDDLVSGNVSEEEV